MRFALSTILLLVTISGLSFALWMERTRKPDVLYLHLYSNRYDIYSMGKLPPHPRDWQRIATISVVSGADFYADLPCHYEPEMSMAGTITLRGSRVDTNFTIDVADVGPAYRHEQKTPVPLNSVHDFGDGDFKFSISDNPDGPPLPAR